MSDPTIEAIKQKIDVKDFVGSYVALRPAGRNLKGLCPFHKEKSPSFMVNPERQIWHCFGCAKGGDIFAFLMQFENIEFIEALKVLADRAGIELKRVGTSDQKKYESLYEINRIAKDYYRAALDEPATGKTARDYLLGRGLTEQTITDFELGVAPEGGDLLLRHLTKLGFTVADIERAGLAFKTERGTYYDRFRNRIMFPLHNHFGKVIGFTGRVMPGNENPEVGKYVNSPQTPIFQKSKLLYGFWKTKTAIRDTQNAVLVEGQMDFLMAYQDGVKNLVATSGTALTDEHLKLIRRLAENLTLSFDNDSAGKAAAERTIDLAQANDLNTKVIVFDDPALKDPADIARSKPGHFAELVKKAIPAMEYYFLYYGIDKAGDVHFRKKAIRQALSKIKQVSSPVERHQWVSLLSQRTSISEAALNAEMDSIALSAKPGNLVAANPVEHNLETPVNRIDRVVRRILSIALGDKAVLQRALSAKTLFPERYQKILEYVGQTNQGVRIGDSAIPQDLLGTVNLMYLESGFEPAPREIEDLFVELERTGKTTKRKEMQERIRRAELAHDDAEVARLLEEFRSLDR